MQIDTTVLNGLPVTVEFVVTEQDTIILKYWQIVAIAGKACKSIPDWIMKKLSIQDEYRIENECFNAFYNGA